MTAASKIVLVHNHPSGDPQPSAADHRITKIIREAGEVMQIELLDHVIIGCKEDDPTGMGFYSFRSSGLL